MITPDSGQFPNNIVELVALRAQLLDSDLFVAERPMRSTDPNQSVGVYAALWTPQEGSQEMRGTLGAMEPTLSRYRVVVQGMIRDADKQRGLNVHAVLSRMLRSMLYNDVPLRNALSQLSSSLDGKTERAQRWGVPQQRFFTNELQGEWVYLSILEFWLETETV